MVEIVPNEPVNDRRLRAGGFQGGVGVNHAGGGIEAGIGNTTLAHTAIVAGDFFQQELDGVVSVGTFIKVYGGGHSGRCLRTSSGRGHPGRQRYSPISGKGRMAQAFRDSCQRHKVKRCTGCG